MEAILDRNEIAYKIKTTCSFYDYIVDFPSNDKITNALKDEYAEFVVDNVAKNQNIELVKRYDVILGEYINNRKFFKEVQRTFSQYFDTNSEYECVIVNLFEELDYLYSNFMEEEISSSKKGTRWI